MRVFMVNNEQQANVREQQTDGAPAQGVCLYAMTKH